MTVQTRVRIFGRKIFISSGINCLSSRKIDNNANVNALYVISHHSGDLDFAKDVQLPEKQGSLWNNDEQLTKELFIGIKI